MNVEIIYPWWYLLGCAVVGVSAAFFLYYRDAKKKGYSVFFQWFKFILRSVVLSALLFLLLEPLLEDQKKLVEKPIIVFAQDNSESISLGLDSIDLAKYATDYDELKRAVGDDFDVKSYSFGSSFREEEQSGYTDKETNFSQLFSGVNDLYKGRNIGALVISTDGVNNVGGGLLGSSRKIEGIPVFTIGLGDTALQKDVGIERIRNNDLAYLGNDFQVVVDVSSELITDTARVQISKNGKVIASKSLNLSSVQKEYAVGFEINAGTVGRNKFEVNVTQFNGEVTHVNNSMDFYLEILDNKQKILILAASPHPDISAIRKSLEHNINYDVSVQLVDDQEGSLEDYSMIVLHQLPSKKLSKNGAVKDVVKSDVPLLFVFGAETNVLEFNKLGLGVQLKNPNGLVDVGGFLASDFALFSVDNGLQNLVGNCPPLQVPFASEYKVSGKFNTLLYQQIGLASTNYPLITYGDYDDKKIGVFFGEGLWRWKLYEYSRFKRNETVGSMISNSVKYLASKADKRKFRLDCKPYFNDNESVVMFSELYNQSYELINDPEVVLSIVADDGDEYPLKSFSRSGNAYRIDAGVLPFGSYSYQASCEFDGEKYLVEGEFQVKRVISEFLNSKANFQEMYDLSSSTGGQFVSKEDIMTLVGVLKGKEEIVDVVYTEKSVKDFINLKWFIFLIVSLLSIEWFVRKRIGTY